MLSTELLWTTPLLRLYRYRINGATTLALWLKGKSWRLWTLSLEPATATLRGPGPGLLCLGLALLLLGSCDRLPTAPESHAVSSRVPVASGEAVFGTMNRFRPQWEALMNPAKPLDNARIKTIRADWSATGGLTVRVQLKGFSAEDFNAWDTAPPGIWSASTGLDVDRNPDTGGHFAGGSQAGGFEAFCGLFNAVDGIFPVYDGTHLPDYRDVLGYGTLRFHGPWMEFHVPAAVLAVKAPTGVFNAANLFVWASKGFDSREDHDDDLLALYHH